MKFLKEIQELPLGTRKIILLTTVSIIGIILIWFWFKNFSGGFEWFQGGKLREEFKMPPLREKLEKDLPKLEVPGLEVPNGLSETPELEI